MTLSWEVVLFVLVVAFVAGFGWTVGCWLASRILTIFK